MVGKRLMCIVAALKGMATAEPTTINIASPVGTLRVLFTEREVVGVDILSRAETKQNVSSVMAKKISRQFNGYFTQPDKTICLPVQLVGTSFQQRVWRALQAIPVGETMSYGALAKKLNSSARAVGNACRANPLPVIVPCHRVVAKSGLGGYSGKTHGRQIAIKRWLLEHEGAHVS